MAMTVNASEFPVRHAPRLSGNDNTLGPTAHREAGPVQTIPHRQRSVL